MTSKLVKLTSLQANNDLGDTSQLDFVIPQGGIYNLQDSYVSIMSEINTTKSSNVCIVQVQAVQFNQYYNQVKPIRPRPSIHLMVTNGFTLQLSTRD